MAFPFCLVEVNDSFPVSDERAESSYAVPNSPMQYFVCEKQKWRFLNENQDTLVLPVWEDRFAKSIWEKATFRHSQAMTT